MTIVCGVRDVTGSGELCPLARVGTLLQSRKIQCDSTWQFARIFLFFPQFGCISLRNAHTGKINQGKYNRLFNL